MIKNIIKKIILRLKQAEKSSNIPYFYPRSFRELYKNTGPIVSGTLARESKTRDDLVMIVDPARALILHQFLIFALNIEGDVAECGVYKGGTAYILERVLVKNLQKKELHLFDSFQGLPETLPIDGPHKKGDFGDASLDLLEKRLEGGKYKCYPGFFKDTLPMVSNLTFCFVHIDVDIYNSAKECTEFFYPRVRKGGVIIYDDYGFETTKGVKKLVDEFYVNKPESPIILPTKQCLIIKQ